MFSFRRTSSRGGARSGQDSSLRLCYIAKVCLDGLAAESAGIAWLQLRVARQSRGMCLYHPRVRTDIESLWDNCFAPRKQSKPKFGTNRCLVSPFSVGRGGPNASTAADGGDVKRGIGQSLIPHRNRRVHTMLRTEITFQSPASRPVPGLSMSAQLQPRLLAPEEMSNRNDSTLHPARCRM